MESKVGSFESHKIVSLQCVYEFEWVKKWNENDVVCREIWHNFSTIWRFWFSISSFAFVARYRMWKLSSSRLDLLATALVVASKGSHHTHVRVRCSLLCSIVSILPRCHCSHRRVPVCDCCRCRRPPSRHQSWLHLPLVVLCSLPCKASSNHYLSIY